MVEFTRTSELADTGTNVAFGNFVKLGLNTELETKLDNGKVLNDESELNRNVVAVIFGVDEMFKLDSSTPPEVVTTTVRLVAKVLGNVRVPLVLFGKNTDVVKVTKVDLSLIDVEFTTAVLSAVEGNCEMETWIRQQKHEYLKIPVLIPYSLHLLEDDIRDRSMQTLHVVCHVACSGSRPTAGKRKIVLFFFTSCHIFVYQKRKKYGILRKGKLIKKS